MPKDCVKIVILNQRIKGKELIYFIENYKDAVDYN